MGIINTNKISLSVVFESDKENELDSKENFSLF